MELISKDDVIKALQKWNCRDYDSLTINPYEVLRDIPTIEERKEGMWIPYLPEYEDMFKCSKCKEIVRLPYKRVRMPYNYCPNCGAKMKGE